jgi:hypothetical protein
MVEVSVTKPNVKNILAQLNPDRSFIANNLISKDIVPFSEGRLQTFFEGGLREGQLSEWGLRPGSGGREVLVDLLAAATQTQKWSLWVRPKSGVAVYPPAWNARGVKLDRMRFAYTDQPIADLKPLFMDSFFKLIIIDEPKNLSDEECSFLARRAQEQKQIICIIRPYFLCQKRGNVWAKLRVNMWRTGIAEQLCLQVIKGLSPRQMSLHKV